MEEAVNVLLTIFRTLIGVALASLVLAFVLQLATKVVAKFHLRYSRAYSISFLVIAISRILRFLVISSMGELQNIRATAVFISICYFFILSLAFGSIKQPGAGPIGIGKGMLISLLMTLVSAGILLLIRLVEAI